MHPTKQNTMKSSSISNVVTDQELTWAKQIKQAIKKQKKYPEFSSISIDASRLVDLEILQHAIISKGNISKALQRIQRMQAFKDRYGIKLDGSFDEGKRDLQTFFFHHPNFLLSFQQATAATGSANNNKDPDANAATTALMGPHVVCTDHSQMITSKIMKTEESIAIWLRGIYYMMQATCPTVAAMRAGMVYLADGQGMTFAQNYSLRLEERAAQLYSHAYAVRLVLVCTMNANVVLRAFYRIICLFLSKKTRERHVVAGNREKFLASRASHQFTRPNVLPVAWGGIITQESVRPTMEAKLAARYQLASQFRLQLSDDDDSDEEDDEDEIPE